MYAFKHIETQRKTNKRVQWQPLKKGIILANPQRKQHVQKKRHKHAHKQQTHKHKQQKTSQNVATFEEETILTDRSQLSHKRSKKVTHSFPSSRLLHSLLSSTYLSETQTQINRQPTKHATHARTNARAHTQTHARTEWHEMWSRLAPQICHFFWLITRNQDFFDKKCRVLTIRDKKCRISTFCDKNCHKYFDVFYTVKTC